MKALGIAMPVKAVGWMDLIVEIKENEEREFPWTSQKTVKPMISSRVKDKYPLRQYKTDTTTIPGRFFVKRDFDLKIEELDNV